MAADRSLIFEFVSEAKEHLANVADDLLALEQRRDDSVRYRVDRLFRAVHSVKGGAGFFGCRTVEELAHAMETVLDQLREQPEPPAGPVIDALLAGNDRILALLDDVERSHQADVGDLLARLRSLLPAGAPAPPPPPVLPARDFPLSAPVLAPRPPQHVYLYGLSADLAECDRGGWRPLRLLQRLQEIGAILDARLDLPDARLDAGLPAGPLRYQALFSSGLAPDRVTQALGVAGVHLVLLEPVERPAPPPPAVRQVTPPAEEPTLPAPADRGNTLRIPVQLVDRLMTLAGELVLVRNQALRAIDPADAALRPVGQRLDTVTGELQEAVLRTRMQPVGNLFGKFPRLVRDLARQLGKEIELEVAGTEVELDKTILEALSDPLTHLVRNGCDHGIEPADVRLRSGKPPQGLIRLSARHLAGQIYLEVRDDGRGIDPQVVKQKAAERGLRTAADLARLGDRDLLGLILLPGFSTAAAVTDVSGRGVGMDVVKTNLDRLGGVLDIDSAPGRGTTFTLRLPLTLAIIPCLVVGAGGERYALPQKDLEELVCLQPGQARARVEHAYDQEVIRLRDRLLPLVRLGEVLRWRAPFTAETRAKVLGKYRNPAEGLLFFGVVKVGDRRFGLVVDEIFTTEEIVVKPMHGVLQPLACFAGATIMGDGRVSLILSIEGVARHAGVRFDVMPEQALPAPNEVRGGETQEVLLFRYGPSEQFALPLAMVRRVELVRMDRVERVGEEEFLTLDGVPTAVLRPDRFLSVSACEDREQMFLILPKGVRRPLGLLASAVLDTETVPLDVDPGVVGGDGLVGSGVVRGQLTLFPDVYRLADLAQPPPRPRLPAPAEGMRRVLLVEDTQFFRELVRGYLEEAGYEVETAVHGADGLARLDAGAFDAVVSDIEMPEMDGWAFARAVRQRPGGERLPLVALTTLNSERDREKARACGFDRYEVKVDRERFLGTVAELLRLHEARGEP
jgi:two-component system, chemotaxis family, sensor kinase CheA